MGTPKKKSEIVHKVLDGEATRKETTIIRKDPAAREEYRALKKITDLGREMLGPSQPPPGFKDRVIRNIKSEPRPRT